MFTLLHHVGEYLLTAKKVYDKFRDPCQRQTFNPLTNKTVIVRSMKFVFAVLRP